MLIVPGWGEIVSETKLTAVQMECNQQDQTCKASGNACVERGEGKEKKRLTASTLVAKLKKDRTSNTNRVMIERVEAEGGVVLKISEGTVYAQSACYSVGEDRIDFRHQVSIYKKLGLIEGDSATVFPGKGEFSIICGEVPVWGLIYPERSGS